MWVSSYLTAHLSSFPCLDALEVNMTLGLSDLVFMYFDCSGHWPFMNMVYDSCVSYTSKYSNFYFACPS